MRGGSIAILTRFWIGTRTTNDAVGNARVVEGPIKIIMKTIRHVTHAYTDAKEMGREAQRKWPRMDE